MLTDPAPPEVAPVVIIVFSNISLYIYKPVYLVFKYCILTVMSLVTEFASTKLLGR